MATVKLFGNLRTHVAGNQIQISGEDVQTILAGICEAQPSLCEAIFENGKIRPHFKIILNGHDIQLTDGLETPVKDNDQLAIFPPIAGG